MDPDGRFRFELLQAGEAPVTYLVFDILELQGQDVIALPYEDRRRLLDQAVEPGANWLLSPWQVGGGAALLEASREQGLEGVMAKRLDSPYVPGRRSPAWRKIKNRHRQELVVGGWTSGEGNRASTFGALLVGYYDERRAALRRRGRDGLHGGDAGHAHAPAEGVDDRRRARSTRARRRRSSATSARTGCNRAWSARWSSPSGPTKASSATPATSACARTNPGRRDPRTLALSHLARSPDSVPKRVSCPGVRRNRRGARGGWRASGRCRRAARASARRRRSHRRRGRPHAGRARARTAGRA